MNRKKRIVLVRPKANEKEKLIVTPLSLLTVAAPLDRKGYDIKIVDSDLEEDYIEKILEYSENAICIGITSITGYQICDGLKISKAVKKKFPKLPIVWGGWHATVAPKETATSPYIDVAVKGQGEVTFQELVYAFEKNKSIDKIKGIAFKKKGKVVMNPLRPFEDLNKFPPIPYHLIDIEKYISARHERERTIEYRSSQGCPFHCNFCAESCMTGMRWSGLKAERVVGELENLVKKYKIESILFFENNFFLDKERVRKISKGVLKKKLKIKMRNMNARVRGFNNFEPELMKLIKKAGVRDILIGAESGNQKVLDLINKRIKVGDITETKRICHKYGLMPFVSLMTGFPFEEVPFEEEFNDTLNLIERIQEFDNNNFFFVNIYLSYPGTELYEYGLKKGLEKKKSLEEWSKFDLTTKNPWVPEGFEKKIEHINNYVIRIPTKRSERDWENLSSNLFLKKFFIFTHKILSRTAKFRLKHRFFSFPIEYKFLKMISPSMKG